MATRDYNIYEAFAAHLQTLSLSPAVPVTWENVPDAPIDSGWIQASFLPGDNERLGVNPRLVRRRGFFQLTVKTPVDYGSSDALAITSAIQEHFPEDLRLRYGGTTARVTTEPSVAGGMRDGNWWATPVTIYYESLGG